jgi:carboxylesterase type B
MTMLRMLRLTGLFKRGYSQSGSTLCPWAQMERGRDKAIMLAQALGCNTQDSQELVECLSNRPARQIVQQVENFQVSYIHFT